MDARPTGGGGGTGAAVAAPQRSASDPQLRAAFLRLGPVAVIAATGFAAFSFYESRYLGYFPLGEVPPLLTPWHAARTAFAFAIAVLAVRTIWRLRGPGSPLERAELPAAGGAAAWFILAAALASTLFFLADPAAFGASAQEDRPVEWISALLLLAGSALFLDAARQRLRLRGERIGLLVALGFAFVFFVTGMEEISWLQRVVGFGTPAELAEANMQGEFNLHNVHTDLSENIYYVGAAAFLILLPFLHEAVPAVGRVAHAGDFIPGRWVVAASAPLSIFNYGMWNVIPMQMTMMLTFLVTAFYARAAGSRGSRGEAALFAALALAVLASQAAFLARGHLMPKIWDASEYKELFIAAGLFCFALDVALRTRARAAAQAIR